MKTPSDISISKLLGKAWENTAGIKWQVLWPLLSLILTTCVLMTILTVIYGPSLSDSPDWLQLAPLGFLVSSGIIILGMGLMTWYAATGLTMLGVYRMSSKKVHYLASFAQCRKVLGPLSLVLFVSVLLALIVGSLKYFLPEHGFMGFLLHCIVSLISIYITLPLTVFAIPFIVTKTYKPGKAIKQSYHLMKKYGIKLVITIVIMSIFMLISMIPLGIGLIWTIPMIYALQGAMFTSITGIKPAAPSKK